MWPLFHFQYLVIFVPLRLSFLSWFSVNYFHFNHKTLGMLMLILKVRLIIVHYMELAKTHAVIRWEFEGWIILAGGNTIDLYIS